MEKEYLNSLKDLITFEGEEKFSEEEIPVLYYELSELRDLRTEIKSEDTTFLEKEHQLLTKLDELLRPYEKLHKYFLKLFHQYLPVGV